MVISGWARKVMTGTGVTVGSVLAITSFVHEAVGDAWKWPIAGIGAAIVIGSSVTMKLGARERRPESLPIAPHIQTVLKTVEHHRPPAIDDSILLHRFSRRFRLEEVKLDFGAPQRPDAPVLTHPSAQELRDAIAQADLDRRTTEYLRSRIGVGSDSVFYPKIGLRAVSYETPRMNLPLTLRVAPLSFWLEEQFNRRIITDLQRDRLLEEFSMDCRAKIINSWNNGRRGFSITGVSSLFVEVAIVTRDDELMIVQKRAGAGGSDSRRIGRGWSCTLEEGIRWDKADPAGLLNMGVALNFGLATELDVAPEQVTETRWMGIALENHLNTGILGYTRLNLSRRELQEKIPNDDFEECEFVGFSDIERIFAPRYDGMWHTTARLRAFLTFAELVGESAVRRQIQEIRRKVR